MSELSLLVIIKCIKDLSLLQPRNLMKLQSLPPSPTLVSAGNTFRRPGGWQVRQSPKYPHRSSSLKPHLFFNFIFSDLRPCLGWRFDTPPTPRCCLYPDAVPTASHPGLPQAGSSPGSSGLSLQGAVLSPERCTAAPPSSARHPGTHTWLQWSAPRTPRWGFRVAGNRRQKRKI